MDYYARCEKIVSADHRRRFQPFTELFNRGSGSPLEHNRSNDDADFFAGPSRGMIQIREENMASWTIGLEENQESRFAVGVACKNFIGINEWQRKVWSFMAYLQQLPE
jgi:hypothetical protein